MAVFLPLSCGHRNFARPSLPEGFWAGCGGSPRRAPGLKFFNIEPWQFRLCRSRKILRILRLRPSSPILLAPRDTVFKLSKAAGLAGLKTFRRKRFYRRSCPPFGTDRRFLKKSESNFCVGDFACAPKGRFSTRSLKPHAAIQASWRLEPAKFLKYPNMRVPPRRSGKEPGLICLWESLKKRAPRRPHTLPA